MKNVIKLAALSAVMLTGLSGQAIADAGDSRILKRIQDRGVVTIGHRETSIPFSYIGNDEKPIGYSIDICLKIVDAIRAELDSPNLDYLVQL